MNGATASAASVAIDLDEGEGKNKSPLVLEAEKIDRRTALLSGTLRKLNSQDKWQKRYFEIVGHYWVYYKSNASDQPMLCSMDLWRAGVPSIAAPEPGEAESCCFTIGWDRDRLFRAATPQDALTWVNAMKQVQATRPSPTPSTEADRSRALAGPPTPALSALRASAGAEKGAASDAADAAAAPTEDWSNRERKRKSAEARPAAGAGGDSSGGGSCCGRCVIS